MRELRRGEALKRKRGNNKSGPNAEGFGPLGSGFVLDRKSTDSAEHGALMCLCRYSTSTSTCEIP